MNRVEKVLLFLGFCVLVSILIWLIKKGELGKNKSSITYDCVGTQSGYHNCVNISSNESGTNSNDLNKKGKYNSLEECNVECNKLNNTIQKSISNTVLEYPYDYTYPYDYINEYPYLYDYRYPYNYVDEYPYTIYQHRRRGRGGKGDRYGRGGKGRRTESGVGVTINRVMGGKGIPDSGGIDSTDFGGNTEAIAIDVGGNMGGKGGIDNIGGIDNTGGKGGLNGSGGVNIDSIDVGGNGLLTDIDGDREIIRDNGRSTAIDGVNISSIDVGGIIGGKGGIIGGKGGI
jgi:hypothetical protein